MVLMKESGGIESGERGWHWVLIGVVGQEGLLQKSRGTKIGVNEKAKRSMLLSTLSSGRGTLREAISVEVVQAWKALIIGAWNLMSLVDKKSNSLMQMALAASPQRAAYFVICFRIFPLNST